ERRPEDPRAHPPEIDRELCGERARRELRERKTLDVVVLADPALALDEVALHVASEGDRSAEPQRAEPQEVPHEPAQRDRSQFGLIVHGTDDYARASMREGL